MARRLGFWCHVYPQLRVFVPQQRLAEVPFDHIALPCEEFPALLIVCTPRDSEGNRAPVGFVSLVC